MKIFMATALAGTLLTACNQAPSIIPSDKPYSDNDGLLFYSAWRCASLASYTGDVEEQERLFELGYEVAKGFINRGLNKSMEEEEWKKAPIGVTWELSGGPSADFQLGSLFKSISTDVYEEVVKEDRNGIAFDGVLDWRDEELRKIYASELFSEANCSILK